MNSNLICELLITKLCHDLSGPISAIYNGIEFINMDDKLTELIDNKAYELISENSVTVVNQLKFYRYIYGINDSKIKVNIFKLEELLQNFFLHSKLAIVIEHEKVEQDLVNLNNKAAKLLLILIYIAADLLIYGGKIKISLAKNKNAYSINILATADKKIKQYFYQDVLNNSKASVNFDNALTYKAMLIAKQLKCKINVEQQENVFSLSYNYID